MTRFGQILLIAMGVVFLLSGGCTTLFWTYLMLADSEGYFRPDVLVLGIVATGLALTALGVWLIRRGARGGRPPGA